jgi:hypothetical protein
VEAPGRRVVGDRADVPRDELAGSVEGDIAASISVNDRGDSLINGAEKRVGGRSNPTGIRRRVLKEQQVVVGSVQECVLQIVRLGKRNSSE